MAGSRGGPEGRRSPSRLQKGATKRTAGAEDLPTQEDVHPHFTGEDTGVKLAQGHRKSEVQSAQARTRILVLGTCTREGSHAGPLGGGEGPCSQDGRFKKN